MSKPIQSILEQRLGESLESFLRRRYNEGKGCTLIAKELDINKTIVLNYMNKFGIKRNKSKHNEKVRIQKQLELKYGNLREYIMLKIKEGQLVKDLAKELDINAYTLSLWCKEWNIAIDREGRPIEFYKLEQKFNGKLKEFLEEEYFQKKRSIRDVGKELELKGDLLKRFLEYFKIPIRGRVEASKVRDNVPEIKTLTFKEEQVIYGSLMGDGCISCHTRDGYIQGNAWFLEGHCIKQERYLRWKVEVLERLGDQFYYTNGRKTVAFKTSHLEVLTQLRKCFYDIKGKKSIRKEILNKIDTLGLSVWYQDDGWYNSCNKNACVATHGFTYYEHLLMQEYFRERWKLDVRIHKRKSKESGNFKPSYKEYYYLYFPVKDTPRFFEIIKPHIHETMLYKIGIDK